MLASYPITLSALRSQRRSFLLWSIAYAGIVAMYAGLYPFAMSMDLGAMARKLPEGFSRAMGYDQIGTAAGYVSSSVFGLLGPAILAVFGIGLGSRLIAGEEEEGTLELELTGPSSEDVRGHVRFGQGRDLDHATFFGACKASSSRALRSSGSSLWPLTLRN